MGDRLYETAVQEKILWPPVLQPLQASPDELELPEVRQPALISRAEELFGGRCVRTTSTSGGYNFIDFLHMSTSDNTPPFVVVARTASKQKLATAFHLQVEIDTMVYVRAKTAIPVPKVYGYHCTSGLQQYMFIEFIEGEIVQGWPSDHDTQFMHRTVRDLARIVFDLSRLRFSGIGSLLVKDHSTTDVTLGPWCSLEKTSHDLALGVSSHGPWASASMWLESLLQRRIAQCDCPAVQAKLLDAWFPPQLLFGREHPFRDRFERGRTVYPQLAPHIAFHSGDDDPELASSRDIFCLTHGDLNAFNLIMQPDGPDAGKIIGVLDWELASVVPIWAAHNQHFDMWVGSEDDTELADVYTAEISRLEAALGGDGVLARSIGAGRHCRHFALLLLVEPQDIEFAEEWLVKHERVPCRECCPVSFLAI